MNKTFLDRENWVRDNTRGREAKILGVMSPMLEQFLVGFSLIGNFKKHDKNRREQVWLYLTSRAFNSLRLAYDLLEGGYYQQSNMLTRAAWEDWLCCEDSRTYSKTIDALLDGEGEIPVPHFKEMSDRLPKNLKEAWQHSWVDNERIPGAYGNLSTSTHPSRFSVATTVTESGHLRIGPAYDEDLFLLAAVLLVRGMIMTLDILNILVNAVAPDWT